MTRIKEFQTRGVKGQWYGLLQNLGPQYELSRASQRKQQPLRASFEGLLLREPAWDPMSEMSSRSPQLLASGSLRTKRC